MRTKKDVRNGDVVWRNKRGWWCRVDDDAPLDVVYKVWENGSVRDLTSEEWTEIGQGIGKVFYSEPRFPIEKGVPDWLFWLFAAILFFVALFSLKGLLGW